MFDSKLQKYLLYSSECLTVNWKSIYFITQFDSKLKTFILQVVQLRMFDSELQKHLILQTQNVSQ